MRAKSLSVGIGVVALACVAWSWSRAESARELRIPQEIVALAQDTRVGGLFEIEVDASGKVLGYSSEIDLEKVPVAAREAGEKALPGGKFTAAEKEIIGTTTYFEIEKEFDGLMTSVMISPDGKVMGKERALPAKDHPKQVVEAADKAVPGGDLVAVEHVEGAEALGGVGSEHHVKKRISGEVIRIRVTDKGAVEVLRRIRTEIKVPKK